ncbi:hypothetical protein BJ508DRAFT_306801 [Ascobolus immersus RN42]|uniref:Uncharacterized protein n=1 Tax=Ascobolus immersus RN42 TaxID=1160509 RepID=A0A3N4I4P5_ASCIM|nr:hypothetical protein BJ508DRAFT_306801 [Ascobolus immersus RN42]
MSLESQAVSESSSLLDTNKPVNSEGASQSKPSYGIGRLRNTLSYVLFIISMVLILFSFFGIWFVFTQPASEGKTGYIKETYGFFQKCTGLVSSPDASSAVVTCKPFPTLQSCGSRFPQVGWFTCSQIRNTRLLLSFALGCLALGFFTFTTQLMTGSSRVLKRVTSLLILLALGCLFLGLGYALLYRSYLGEKKKMEADDALVSDVQEWRMGMGWKLASGGFVLLFTVWFLTGNEVEKQEAIQPKQDELA